MTLPSAGRCRLSTLSFLLLAVAAVQVGAEPLPVGPEFQVNTYTTDGQGGETRNVARSADGSFVVVWESLGQDGDGYSVHGQRYDATGAADGIEFDVNSYTTDSQDQPAVSSAAEGSFVVVWRSLAPQDGDAESVQCQRFDATGAPDGTEFQVNTYTTDDQQNPAVSSTADGSFVVVWSSFGQDGDVLGINGQRFDATGAADGTEFQINSYTTGYQVDPSISSAADGSFVVVWESTGEPGDDSRTVRGQRYDATGTPDGTQFQINTFTTGRQTDPVVSSAPDGSFVVAWDGGFDQDGDGFGLFGQRFDATGAPEGTEFQINSYTTSDQFGAAVASDGDGAFVVTWESESQDGDDLGVHGQRFDATGAADGTEFQVNSYTTARQSGTSIASDGVGNFVVVWESDGQDGSYDGMFGQLLCSDRNSNGNCDDGRCPAVAAAGCAEATQAKIDYDEKKAGKEKMKLKWKKLADATTQAAFGDPVTGMTAASLCIYDDASALVQEFLVDRAGDLCVGKDCWKAAGGTKGYVYKDKDSTTAGVSKIGYQSGPAGKGKADAKGRNNSSKGQLDLPTDVVASLNGNLTPTIQLVTSEDLCVSATMNLVKTDEFARYTAVRK